MHDIDSVPQHKRSTPKPHVILAHRAGLLSQYRQHRESQGNGQSLSLVYADVLYTKLDIFIISFYSYYLNHVN